LGRWFRCGFDVVQRPQQIIEAIDSSIGSNFDLVSIKSDRKPAPGKED